MSEPMRRGASFRYRFIVAFTRQGTHSFSGGASLPGPLRAGLERSLRRPAGRLVVEARSGSAARPAGPAPAPAGGRDRLVTQVVLAGLAVLICALAGLLLRN
jgi:hypothetical protein